MIKIYNNNKPDLGCQEVFYTNAQSDTLACLLNQYDNTLNVKETNVAIGNSLIKDLNIPVSSCLFYGSTITIYSRLYNVTLKSRNGKQRVTISIDSNKRVYDLKQHCPYECDLIYNKQILDETECLRDVLKDNCDVIMKKIERNLRIQVADLDTGIDYFYNVSESDRFYYLAQKIQNQLSIRYSSVRIISNGRRIHDFNLTIAECDIEHLDVVEVYRERCGGGGGGGAFADLEECPEIFEWTKSAPDWRIAKPGLCLEGECLNKSCAAFQKYVVINMPTPIIYELGVGHKHPTNCPICNSHVDPSTCAFNNCEWRFFGIKNNNKTNEQEKVESDWQETDNKYYRFNESKSVDWGKLLIETRYHDHSKSLTRGFECAICLEDDSYQMKKLSVCKHKFHAKCVDIWLAISKTCPLCRQ